MSDGGTLGFLGRSLLAAAFLLGNRHVAQAEAQERIDVRPRPQPSLGQADGVYGRFDGDLDLGFGVGGQWVHGNAAATTRASLHYFSSVGVWGSGSWSIGSFGDGAGNSSVSSFAFGVDLRPAFLPRFSENMEQGPPMLDLALDAISLSLGPYWTFTSDDQDLRGLEISLGTGLALLSYATGPWLEVRGIARVPDSSAPTDYGAVLLFSWHQMVDSALTERPRR